MKKTLLAAATLSALMASGMANAAFTDADGSGGWTDSLEFNGTITNTNPAWKYQIPEATIAGAKNWNVKRSDGTVDGSNTNFSFAKDFTVLEGVMKAPAPTGRPGLQPVVTFGETGHAVTWDTTNASLATPVKLSLTAKKGVTPVGNLTLQLQGQAADQIVDRGTILGQTIYANVPDAYALLKAQPYYASTYDPYREVDAAAHAPGVGGASTGFLNVTGAEKVSGAIVAKATKFELSVPTASIPDAWTATLPISITVK